MAEALLLKFNYNAAAREALIGTYLISLIECSQHDYTWGAGEDMEAIGGMQQARIPGENLLGAVLMAVRELINDPSEIERTFHRSVRMLQG